MDFWGKIRHQLHFGGVKALGGAEAIGEVISRHVHLQPSFDSRSRWSFLSVVVKVALNRVQPMTRENSHTVVIVVRVAVESFKRSNGRTSRGLATVSPHRSDAHEMSNRAAHWSDYRGCNLPWRSLPAASSIWLV